MDQVIGQGIGQGAALRRLRLRVRRFCRARPNYSPAVVDSFFFFLPPTQALLAAPAPRHHRNASPKTLHFTPQTIHHRNYFLEGRRPSLPHCHPKNGTTTRSRSPHSSSVQRTVASMAASAAPAGGSSFKARGGDRAAAAAPLPGKGALLRACCAAALRAAGRARLPAAPHRPLSDARTPPLHPKSYAPRARPPRGARLPRRHTNNTPHT